MVLKPSEQRSVEEEPLLAKLKQHPDLAAAIHLAQQFADLVRQRQPKQLDLWLEQASRSPIKQFQNFAKSLQKDYQAVKEGVTLAISNGQVEGQINRLKMLKRQMYGRAGFDLLQRRVLLACSIGSIDPGATLNLDHQNLTRSRTWRESGAELELKSPAEVSQILHF